ncbi:MAG: ThuA domain-containing protein [Bryobacterales bacterium]|nr:ThuA domain-containing protein [Bryobacterales bacterium]
MIAFFHQTALPAQPVYLIHDDADPMIALADGLNRKGIRSVLWTQEQAIESKDLDDSLAVVMYIHHELKSVTEQKLIHYAKSGGRLIVLHHGLASGKVQNPKWLDFLGVRLFPNSTSRFPWRVLRGKYQLINLKPFHYVTSHDVVYPATVPYVPSDTPSVEQNLPAIEFPQTEIFLNQVFADAREKTVLFGFRTEIAGTIYMQDRGGWMMKAGKGWVFYFQPGHWPRDFENQAYIQILANAIQWQQ